MHPWSQLGFSVHGAVRVETRDEAARLKWDEERREVVYTAHPRKTGGPYGSEARWDVLDFIARMTQHIPNVGQQLQRTWGFYSNAARGKRLREAAEDSESSGEPTAGQREDQDVEAWKKRRRISWAQLIRKVFEVDPMLCPFCRANWRHQEVLGFDRLPEPRARTSRPFSAARRAHVRALLRE